MKLTEGAALIVRMFGQNSAFTQRPATIAKVGKKLDGAQLADCLVSRDQGEPFEVTGVHVYSSKDAAPVTMADVVAWPAEDAPAEATPPTRANLNAALAALPGDHKDPDYVVKAMRAFYGADLFTDADEAKVREVVKAPAA